MTTQSLVAIAISAVAVVAWLIELLVQWRMYGRQRQAMLMPLTALIASLGTLASAAGLAQSTGAISIHIDPEILVLVSSMGRGALAAAGIIVLTERRIVRRLRL